MKSAPLVSLTTDCRSAWLLAGIALLSLLPAGAARGQASAEEKPLVSHGGFVFLDGEYIAPPYVVKEADSGVGINGRVIKLSAPAGRSIHKNSEDWGRGERGRGGWDGRFPRRSGHWWPAETNSRPEREDALLVATQLNADAILLAEGGKNVSILCHERQIYEFLGHLLGMTSSDQTVRVASNPFITAAQRIRSSRFSPTPELGQRAQETIARIDAASAEDTAVEEGLERLSMLAFPLTMVGMILSVLASGHLITYPPRPIEFLAQILSLSEIHRLFKQSHRR